MATSLMSLALGAPVRKDLAMTGELTLTGRVLKVGGIKEKVIAAKRDKVSTVLLPRANMDDYMDLKAYLRAGLTAHFVDHYDDVYNLSFDEGSVPNLPLFSRGLPIVTVEPPTQDELGESTAALGGATAPSPSPAPAACTVKAMPPGAR